MMSEGRGLVIPKPILVTLEAYVIRDCENWAEKVSRHRGYAARADTWGRGLIENPAFIGRIGECAVCQYLNRALGVFSITPDWQLRPSGDGGIDLECWGYTMEIKTRTHVTGDRQVRRINSQPAIVSLKADAHVFALYDPRADREVVWLDGWLASARIREYGQMIKSHRGPHWNLRLDPRYLEPMSRLVDELESRRPA